MLKCNICGYEHPTMISPSHLKKHGISGPEYKLKYPGAALRIQTEESRLKTAASKKGKAAWNAGIKTGPNLKLSESTKGKPKPKLRGLKRTDEQRAKISDATKKVMSGVMTDVVREKIKASYQKRKLAGLYVAPMLGKQHSEETKKLLSIRSHEAIEINRAKWVNSLQERASGSNISVIDLKNQYVNLCCNACNNTFRFSRQYFQDSAKDNHNARDFDEICPTCFPRLSTKSKLELDFYEFCKNIRPDLEIRNGDRSVITPQEIDVYIPSLKLGFEITGNYWHSEQIAKNAGRSKFHLLEKHQACEAAGIRLITIFEDELTFKYEIVKSRIANLLKVSQQKIFARNTKIKEIDKKLSSAFLKANHIQDADKPSLALGAFYNDELVSVMTFKKTTFIKGGKGTEIELSRFASKLNTNVVGIASKFISYFQQYHNTAAYDLISYSDKRWSDGSVYRQIGFSYSKSSPPSYFYLLFGAGENSGKRIHRSNFMKHRLDNIFDTIHDKSLSEYQIMQSHNYDRIWDCGTDKWILKK